LTSAAVAWASAPRPAVAKTMVCLVLSELWLPDELPDEPHAESATASRSAADTESALVGLCARLNT